MEGGPPATPDPDESPSLRQGPRAPERPTGRPLVLQPMAIGELLDAAIKLYRLRWKTLMAIVAIVLVPITFLDAFLTRSLGGSVATQPPPGAGTAADGVFVASGILAIIQFLFVQPFLTAAVARAAADTYLGEPISVGGTFRFAISRVHSILWISLLAFLAASLGFLLLVIPGIIVLIRYAFASTVLVVEGRKGRKALGRSWRLAHGHFWKILGALVLAFLMAGIVAAIVAIPGTVAFSAVGPSGWPLAALGESLGSVITTPFATLVTVLLYFDLRIRKEAFDLSVMAQEIASSS